MNSRLVRLFLYKMILVYSHITTPRLKYICEFIFKEQLGLDFTICNDIEICKTHTGPIINYSENSSNTNHFHIPPHSLLFEKNIKKQSVTCFETNRFKAFFKIDDADFYFDILAASFYLLSRYEEYLPHHKDQYGRYSHENAVAFKNNFLDTPLINIWIEAFATSLQLKFPQIAYSDKKFQFKPTYDIDIAWSFQSKGIIRNLGGFLSSPSMTRLKVLIGWEKDPFDCYDYLDSIHKEKNYQPIYFFLVANIISKYDKNISPYKKSMKKLIQRHKEKYIMGIHPSWKSNKRIFTLQKEKKRLERIAQQPILCSRQHYIKMSLPETYENLISIGIEKEYSMGYGGINGFRASVASSFYWYHLLKEETTNLRVYPFCYMDATSFYQDKKTAAASYIELMNYYEACKKTNGLFITIFHNNFFGTDKQHAGWKEMYNRFISQVQQ